MSKAARRFFWLPVLLVVIGIAIWAIGCGGGGGIDTGGGGGGGDTPAPTTGNFRVSIKVPVPPDQQEEGSRIVPATAAWLKVTTESEDIAGAADVTDHSAIDQYGFATVTLASVPVGRNIATIGVHANDDGSPAAAALAHVKHGFYMPPGATVSGGLLHLGVAVTSTTTVNPAHITVPVGTRLYYQNWITGAGTATVKVDTAGEDDERSTGAINNVLAGSHPNTPATYYSGNILFPDANTYKYLAGFGGDGDIGNFSVDVTGTITLTSVVHEGAAPTNWNQDPATPRTLTVTGANLTNITGQEAGSPAALPVDNSDNLQLIFLQVLESGNVATPHQYKFCKHKDVADDGEDHITYPAPASTVTNTGPTTATFTVAANQLPTGKYRVFIKRRFRMVESPTNTDWSGTTNYFYLESTNTVYYYSGTGEFSIDVQ
jgi:hypothetical protein